MREKTEHSRSCGQDECDDMEDEAVCYPFYNHVGELDSGAVSEQSVDVWAGSGCTAEETSGRY